MNRLIKLGVFFIVKKAITNFLNSLNIWRILLIYGDNTNVNYEFDNNTTQFSNSSLFRKLFYNSDNKGGRFELMISLLKILKNTN